jgi:hypothetical protein
VVQDEQPLRKEEADEAEPDEQRDAPCVADGVDRLGEDVEEGDRDDDSTRERDQRR